MTVNLSHFGEPPSEREVLRYALKNILTDYAENHDALPFDAEDPNLKSLTDHRTNFGGNYSMLVSQLHNRFDGTSFEVNSADHLELNDLEEIFMDQSASYPLVEVHPDFYEYQSHMSNSNDVYVVQSGMHDESLIPLLIPFSIEEGEVFYYDPFLDFYSTQNAPTHSIRRNIFVELWGRCDITSWALWIDQGEQRTLMDAVEEQS